MQEETPVNRNEKINNPTNLSLNDQSSQPTPLGNNVSLSNEILYFSINQDSE